MIEQKPDEAIPQAVQEYLARIPDIDETSLLKATLAGLDLVSASAIRHAAVPRWFNLELLAALEQVGLGEARRLLDQMLKSVLPASKREGYYTFDDETRATLLEMLRTEEGEAVFIEINRRAAAYFDQNRQEHPSYQGEWLYHQLLIDQATGTTVGFDRFRDRMQAAEGAGRLVSEHNLLGVIKDLLRSGAVEPNLLTREQSLWLEYYDAMLSQESEQWAEAKVILEGILEEEPEPEDVAGRMMKGIGGANEVVKQVLKQAGTALATVSQPISQWTEMALRPRPAPSGAEQELSAKTYAALGRVNFQLGHFVQAADDLEKALEGPQPLSDPVDIGRARLTLGDVCMAMGDPEGPIYREFLRPRLSAPVPDTTHDNTRREWQREVWERQARLAEAAELTGSAQERLRKMALDEYEKGLEAVETKLRSYLPEGEDLEPAIRSAAEQIPESERSLWAALGDTFLILRVRQAEALLSQGEWSKAEGILSSVIEVTTALGGGGRATQALASLQRGDAYLGLDLTTDQDDDGREESSHRVAALRDYQRGLALWKDLGSSQGQAEAYMRLGDYHATQQPLLDHWQQALDAYEKSLDLFYRIGSRHRLGRVQDRIRALGDRCMEARGIGVAGAPSPEEEHTNEILRSQPFRVYSYPAASSLVVPLERRFAWREGIRGGVFGLLMAIFLLLPIGAWLGHLAVNIGWPGWLVSLLYVVLVLVAGYVIGKQLGSAWPPGSYWLVAGLLSLIPASGFLVNLGTVLGFAWLLPGMVGLLFIVSGALVASQNRERLSTYFDAQRSPKALLSMQPDFIITDEVGIVRHSVSEAGVQRQDLAWDDEVWGVRAVRWHVESGTLGLIPRPGLEGRIIPYQGIGKSAIEFGSDIGEEYDELLEDVKQAVGADRVVEKLTWRINPLAAVIGCLTWLLPFVCVISMVMTWIGGRWLGWAFYPVLALLIGAPLYLLMMVVIPRVRTYYHLHPEADLPPDSNGFPLPPSRCG